MQFVWDKMFTEADKPFGEVAESMTSCLPDGCTPTRRFAINYVPEGQIVSRAGSTFGVRLIFESQMNQIELLTHLQNQQVTHCSKYMKLFVCRDQRFPPRFTDFQTGQSVEMMFATVQFSDGRGAVSAKQGRATRSNQAKDTKNKLDFTSTKVGKPIKDLPGWAGGIGEQTTPLFSNAYFYLEKSSDDSAGRSIGAAYQVHTSVASIVGELSSRSKGVWWDDQQGSVFVVDTMKPLHSEVDPRSWHHYSDNFMTSIRQPFDEDKGAGGTLAWEERRGTPSYELEDLEYYAKRLQHPSRSPHVSFGSDQGFIEGLEELFIQDHVLTPWVFSEVIAVVQAYMLSQMPRYWAGCEPDVKILEEVRSE